jgi:hypothetical protein
MSNEISADKAQKEETNGTLISGKLIRKNPTLRIYGEVEKLIEIIRLGSLLNSELQN